MQSPAVKKVLTFGLLAAVQIAYVVFFYHKGPGLDSGMTLLFALEMSAFKVVADGNLAEKRALGAVSGRTRFWSVMAGLGLIGMVTVAFLLPAGLAPVPLLWTPVVALSFVGKAGYVFHGRQPLSTS